MTIEELKQKGALHIERLRDGLDEYQCEIRKLDEEQAGKRLREEWEKRGRTDSWADFYYFELEEEAREKVDALLTGEEKAYLAKLPSGQGEIIYALEEELLEILVKLNAAEMLFSTVYFIKERCTWWGNYRQEYLVFCDK